MKKAEISGGDQGVFTDEENIFSFKQSKDTGWRSTDVAARELTELLIQTVDDFVAGTISRINFAEKVGMLLRKFSNVSSYDTVTNEKLSVYIEEQMKKGNREYIEVDKQELREMIYEAYMGRLKVM